MRLKSLVLKTTNSDGFTLITVLLALVVLSLLITPYFMTQRVARQAEIRAQSIDEVQTVYDAIIQFARENQRYPRPADPSLALANAAFGTEIGVGPYNVAVAPFNTMVLPGLADSGGRAQQVLIGAVPISTLGLPPHLGLDRYGNKLTYAVTESLTVNGGLVPNNDSGAITLLNQYVNDAALLALKAPPNGTNHLFSSPGPGQPLTQFVVVGHGANGVGAYDRNGAIPTACVGAGLEIENCDGDAVFTAQEHMGNNTPIVAGAGDDRFIDIQDIVSLNGNTGTNNTYFDDYVRAEISIFRDRTWAFMGAPGAASVLDPAGNPLNTTLVMGAGAGGIDAGRVGIGVDGRPRGLLEVDGDVVATEGVRARKLCDDVPVGDGDPATVNRCYDVLDIADDAAVPSIFCGAQIGLTGIRGVGQSVTDAGGGVVDTARVSGTADERCNTFVAMPGDFEEISGNPGINECPAGGFVSGIEVVGVGAAAVMRFICQ